jgi:phage shock protein A
MQWLETFTLVMRSQMTMLRERIENPERMIHQLILDMEEELELARRRIAEALADETHLAQEVARAETQAGLWLERATDAVRKGDEALAKSALEQKRRAEDRAVSLKEVLKTQEVETQKLQDAFRDLEDKLRMARRQQRLLLAKMALCQLNDHLDEYGVEADDGGEGGLSDRAGKEQLEREFEEHKRRVSEEC